MENVADIRLGIIGAGTISQSVHLPSARRAGLRVAAICDLSPSRADAVAAAFGTAARHEPSAMLEDPDIDAVLIATPGSHAALAEQALLHGKHVLAEKPLAYTVAEIESLDRLAAERGLVVQVGTMKQHDPIVPIAAAEVAEYRDIRLVRVTVCHPADAPQVAHLRMPAMPNDAPSHLAAAAIADDRARAEAALPGATAEIVDYYSGVLQGSVIHELSLLRALGLALPQEWHAQTIASVGASEPPSLFAHGSTGTAQVVLNWNWLPDHPEYDEEVAVLAANGRMSLRMAKPYLAEARSALTSDRHDGDLRRSTTSRLGHDSAFVAQLDVFAAAILARSASAGALAGAIDDVRTLQRIAQAIAMSGGHAIEIESA